MIGHRLVEKARAAKRIAEGLGESGQHHPAPLRLAGLCGRKQKLDRGDVSLGDARTVDLEGFLPVETFAYQIVDTADRRNAAVNRKSKRAFGIHRASLHRPTGILKNSTTTGEFQCESIYGENMFDDGIKSVNRDSRKNTERASGKNLILYV
jgi:hypothetical protein